MSALVGFSVRGKESEMAPKINRYHYLSGQLPPHTGFKVLGSLLGPHRHQLKNLWGSIEQTEVSIASVFRRQYFKTSALLLLILPES